ncbi:MAG: DUF6034 family protein [Clostridia bacterium]
MKKSLAFLIVLFSLLPHFALADTLHSELNVPGRYESKGFSSATEVSHFLIDAVVEVPDIQSSSIPLYEVALRSFTKVEFEEMARAFGFSNLSKATEEEISPVKPWNPRTTLYRIEENNRRITVANSYNQYSGMPSRTTGEFDLLQGTEFTYTQGKSILPVSSTATVGDITLEQAKGIANNAAASIAPELSLVFYGKMEGIPYLTDSDIEQYNIDGMKPNNLPDNVSAFVFQYARVMNGIPVTFTDDAGSGQDEQNEPYTEFYPYEQLAIVVSSDGLAYMRYWSPYELVGIWQEDCGELLPLEQIMHIAEKMLPLKYATKEIAELQHANYIIHRITFGYARVMMPNEPDRCILKPVWDFFGTYQMSYADNRVVDWPNTAISFLTIDAVTGIVIDRTLGY